MYPAPPSGDGTLATVTAEVEELRTIVAQILQVLAVAASQGGVAKPSFAADIVVQLQQLSAVATRQGGATVLPPASRGGAPKTPLSVDAPVFRPSRIPAQVGV